MKIISVFVVILFFGINSANASEYNKKSVILLNGEINLKMYNYYISNISSGTKKIIVTSLGGDVKYGVLIGRDIISRKLDVVVRDYCLSSCANYILLAGKNKKIEKNSIIGFHGTSFADSEENEVRDKIVNSKSDFIEIEDISFAKQIADTKNKNIENYINDMEFFRLVKAKKMILFNFSGKLLIDDEKYSSKPPYDDYVFWPSSVNLKKCYNIKNVDDRFRPKNEFRLNEDWQTRHPNARLWIGGDNMFDGCNKPQSQIESPKSCTVNTTQGTDDKGLSTTIKTTVCR